MAQSSSSQMPKRLFTVEQANATLPLVEAITRDLSDLAKDMLERQQRLSELISARAAPASGPYAEELAISQSDLQADRQRVQELVDELLELGVEPKGAVEGLIDFPSQLGDRIVYLCWKLGEPQITHWHELHDGFAGRRSLADIFSSQA